MDLIKWLIGFSLLCLFNILAIQFLSRERALRFNFIYYIFKPKKEEFNWAKTLENHRLYFSIMLLSAAILLAIHYLISKEFLDRGIWFFIAVSLFSSKLLEPVILK